MSFALLSKVLRHRFSSFSGTATAVLTVWRAEAVRDEGEALESQWTVGNTDDHEGIIRDIYDGYKAREIPRQKGVEEEVLDGASNLHV